MPIEKDLEVKDKTIELDSKSTISTTTTLYPLEESNAFFSPTRRLLINTPGICFLRLPIPPRDLEIPIQTSHGDLVYLSKREKMYSGNCTLSHAKLGDVVRTEYFFGPNRDPVLYLLDEDGGGRREVKTRGRWTSRAMEFRVLGGEALEWRYASEKLRDGGRVNLLVLSWVDGKSEKGNGGVIAKLVRGNETRTPGSARCSAGNGGELLIDEEALGPLDEGLVVASCLVMLKREIDRRRAMQLAMIGAVVC